jgi:hypothetical protein
VFQQKVACVESFGLKGGTVGWNEKPMADLVAEQLDGTDGRELATQFRIGGIGTVGQDKPNAIVAGRFLVIAEHADDAVGQVDGKAGKHAADFGVQGREGLEDKCMRGFLFCFGGGRHDCSGRTIADSVKIRLGGREIADAGLGKMRSCNPRAA